MGKVLITESLLDDLADAISTKTGESTPLTIAEMTDAVEDIVVPSGSINITQNADDIDIAAYATANVNVSGGAISLQTKSVTPTESAQTITADAGYDGLDEVDVAAISSSYVGSGVSRKSSTDLTVSGATVTAPAGYYESAATKSVDTMTLPTSAASSASSGYISKATISRSTSDQYINIPTGYNTSGAYYKVNAVENGSATGPSSITASSASVSTGSNTLTLTKTGVSTTPTVSAGYVGSATASTATVALTASVTTKAAATYYPSSSDQSIAASQYLTGAQTIKAVTYSGLIASNILSGVTVKIGDAADDDRIASVSGNVTFATYYTGSSAPSSSLGTDGDIYLQTS